MALFSCPECSREVSDQAMSCPHCGYPFDPKNKPVGYPDFSTSYPKSEDASSGCGLFNPQEYSSKNNDSILPSKPFSNASLPKNPSPRKKRRTNGLFVCGVALFAISFFIIFSSGEEKATAVVPKKSAEENKAALIARFDDHVTQGNIVNAYHLATRSPLAQDPDVSARIEKIAEQAKSEIAKQAAEQRQKKESDLLAQAKILPASEIEKNREVYEKLVKLVPENKKYQDKFSHYDELVKKKDKEYEDRLALYGRVPIRSSWDSSYYEVESYLKKVANDPRSIKIEGCTMVYSTDSGWLVGCEYRGSNAFGALVKQSNWFIIRHGQVVKMEPATAYKP